MKNCNQIMFGIKTILLMALMCPSQICQSQSLWDLAKENKELLRFSTLVFFPEVHLSSDEGINNAVDWCKKNGVTRVFIGSWISGRYTAEREVLEHIRSRLEAKGFEVSGFVETKGIGKSSSSHSYLSCYTNEGTKKKLQEIFEFTASIFDEVIIDDFFFTRCKCDECEKARGERTWADYRCDLMTEVSREYILKPAKAVNPDVKIILKYPQWHEWFINYGYDVLRETAVYDVVWVGTEARDYDKSHLFWKGKTKYGGGKVQYGSYYIMRWLGEIGGPKTGGGWFDPLGTTEDTYVEMARHTVLGDAKEVALCWYGGLIQDTVHERTRSPVQGPRNVEKLRTEIPGLFKLARLVRNKPIKGILAPRPPYSNGYDEQYVLDFAGMLGLPLVPTAKIDPDAKAAIFSVHALKDPDFPDKLKKMLDAKKPVLITDGLAKRLSNVNLDDENLTILTVNGDVHSLLKLTREELKPIRNRLLAPFGMKFDAPNKVALCLIGEDCVIVENFNDQPINACLELAELVEARKALVLPVDGNVDLFCKNKRLELTKITPRTLVAVKYQ